MKVEIKNEIKDCEHEWEKKSGFYISVCVTFEEPEYYPPMGIIQLEVCSKCGALRLPNNAESWRGIQVDK